MTDSQLMRLCQIYESINIATGPLGDGEQLSAGAIEVVGDSLCRFYDILQELGCHFKNPVEWRDKL